MQLYKNRKTFSQFLVRNFHQSLNILKKKMLVMTNVFVKLKTAKDVVGQMSKEPCFRTLFDIQYVKGSQRLVKSAWEQFYHVVSPLWGKLIWKTSFLVICKILGVLVNTFTANDKYPLRNYENLSLSIQMQLSEKWNTFSQFFVSFLEFPSDFEQFEKKNMMVIANVFPKLKTVKDVLRQISKKTGFKTPFDSLHVQGSQTLVKAARKPFCQIFSSLRGKLIWKMSPLVICETEGRLLTYWVLMTRMLFRIVRICCSEHKRNYKGKQKTFSQYLLPFLKYTSNFKHFEEKYDRHIYCMSEIKGCQRFS